MFGGTFLCVGAWNRRRCLSEAANIYQLSYFEKTNILSENICTLKNDIENQLNRYIVSKSRLSIIAWSDFLFYQKAVDNSRAPPFNLSKIHKNLRKVEQKNENYKVAEVISSLLYGGLLHRGIGRSGRADTGCRTRRTCIHERIRYYKAYYSLDTGDGIEKYAVFVSKSPQEIYERKLSNEELYAAINKLPNKQVKRIYAQYF